jgi:hypothetical protein
VRPVLNRRGPHLETFLISHKYGRPKDQDAARDRLPIVLVSRYGPGSYDSLAREAVEDTQVIPRAKSLGAGLPTDLPRGATGANGNGGASLSAGDEGGASGRSRAEEGAEPPAVAAESRAEPPEGLVWPPAARTGRCLHR